ncbi:hypothetical protein PRZ48_012786 [Zasmidium cellare]|uniref:DUF7730 domain-containing protein n=1 Tax=Zasmidium cellare TaxID=395010 RepID=A0ABR0E5U2_ZASCE|nr:hypothetical protein PRZ48_012786 [Zasmidium cellare]
MENSNINLDAADDSLSNADYDSRTNEQAAYEANMKACKRLKDDINKVAAAHRDDKPPPFSHAELVVMGIVNHISDPRNEYASHNDIIRWILESFPYYKALVTEKLLEKVLSESEGMVEINSCECYDFIDEKFIHAFIIHDTPIIELEYMCAYSVDVGSATAFLQRWIDPQPERKGCFRFLDLPAEIRNRIYHMVLIFPEPAVRVECFSRKMELTLKAHGRLSRASDEVCCSPFKCSDDCQNAGHFSLDAPQEILDIACTCKQVFSEAVPIFYGGNSFSADGSVALEKFTHVVPTERLRHLKKLHLRLTVWYDTCLVDDQRLQAAISVVNHVASLEEMTVTLRIAKRRDQAHDGSCMHVDPHTMTDLPSFGALIRLLSTAGKIDVFVQDRGYRAYSHSPEKLENVREAVNEFISEGSRIRDRKVEEAREAEEAQNTEEVAKAPDLGQAEVAAIQSTQATQEGQEDAETQERLEVTEKGEAGKSMLGDQMQEGQRSDGGEGQGDGRSENHSLDLSSK